MEAKAIKNKQIVKKLRRCKQQKNCIPVKVDTPEEYNHCGLDAYHEYHPKGKHIPVIERKWKCSDKPWYFLTKKERIAIENKRKQVKMTHEEYIEAYLKQKLTKWEQKHEKPKKDDIFYKEDYPKWVADREAQHDKIVAFLNKKYIKKFTRPLIHHILESKTKESQEMYKQAA